MADLTVNRPMGGPVQQQDQDLGAKGAKKEDGVVAQGIGTLKKMWLHLTGQASTEHSKQLSNLRDQVKHDFGDTGLKHLNTLLQAQGWSAPTSSKLLSDGELETLLNQVEVQARLTDLKKEVGDDIEGLIHHPVAGRVVDGFLKKEFSSENVDFIRMLAGAMEMDEGQDLALLMVCDRFVGEGSEREVNLKGKNQQMVETAKESLKQARSDGDEDGITKATEDLKKALDECKNEIIGLMRNDTFARMKSDEDFGPRFREAVSGIALNQLRQELIQKNLERSGLV